MTAGPRRARGTPEWAQGQAALLRGGFGFSGSPAALDVQPPIGGGFRLGRERRGWGVDSRQYSLASITVMTRSVTVGSLGSGEW
jgi:hypothetical protein